MSRRYDVPAGLPTSRYASSRLGRSTPSAAHRASASACQRSHTAFPNARDPVWSMSHSAPSSSTWSSTKWLPPPSVPTCRSARSRVSRRTGSCCPPSFHHSRIALLSWRVAKLPCGRTSRAGREYWSRCSCHRSSRFVDFLDAPSGERHEHVLERSAAVARRELRRRALGDETTLMQDPDAIREPGGLIEVVRRQQDRGVVLVTQIADEGLDLPLAPDVEAG